MHHIAVVGAGEIGCACALALHAGCGTSKVHNGSTTPPTPSHIVDLLSRDDVFVQEQNARREEHPIKAFRQVPIHLPSSPTLRVASLKQNLEGEPQPSQHYNHVYLCTPWPALLPDDDAWMRQALPSRRGPSVHDFLTRWSGTIDAHRPTANAPPSYVGIFSRGLTTQGRSPASLVHDAMRAASGTRSPAILTMSGPLYASHWAAAHASSSSTSAAPKYSGTSLCAALSLPSSSAAVDEGLAEEVEHILRMHFPRESIMMLRGRDAAEVMELVNACLPLCAFGAGLVSNRYASVSVSALASYAQHALRSTEALINGLLGRSTGTPLPLEAWSALSLACTNYTAKEFVLGRQMDFHFRKQDALRAVFAGAAHLHFSGTADGLHVLMKERQVSSPFFEVLMDSYSTILRASTVGEGLVQEMNYDYREMGSADFPLLQHALHVDEAMLSGDAQRFEAAKKAMESAFK